MKKSYNLQASQNSWAKGDKPARVSLVPSETEKKPAKICSLGTLALIVAVLMFGSKLTVLKLLYEWDDKVFTPCSTICAGQTVSLVFLLVFFRKDAFDFKMIKTIKPKTWFWMSVGTLIFNVIGQYFQNTGLKTVTVTRASIIGRFDTVHLMLLAKPLGIASKAPSKWELSNCFLIVVGIVLTIVLSHTGVLGETDYFIGAGEIFIYITSLCEPISIIINKRFVSHVPIGFFIVYRQVTGTLIYHLFSLVRGVNVFCFTSASSFKLWSTMLWYGPLFTALPKACILYAMFNCDPMVLAIGINLVFMVQILTAILRGENPCQIHSIGILIVAASILSAITREVKRAYAKKAASQQAKLAGYTALAAGNDEGKLEAGNTSAGEMSDQEEVFEVNSEEESFRLFRCCFDWNPLWAATKIPDEELSMEVEHEDNADDLQARKGRTFDGSEIFRTDHVNAFSRPSVHAISQ